MLKEGLVINGIPVVLWGGRSDSLFIAVHGSMSDKEDDCIGIFAEEAVQKGYQVLSFDLPEHGDRKNDPRYKCDVQNCVRDLVLIRDYAQTISRNIGLFACSVGAYFSLVAYSKCELTQSLFLSPVVDMERVIGNLMSSFNVSEDRLRDEKEISLPIGQMLCWDYYCYVKSHPIANWDTSTAILYGSRDDLCEYDVISNFAGKFDCNLSIMQGAEHYFHTNEQLDYLRGWVIGSVRLLEQ